MDTEKQKIFSNLRPVLLSAKGGVKIDNLNSDYRTIIGENIPFKKFGFSSLEAFLRTFPSIRITCRGNQYYVEAMPTEDTVHLTKLISRQKTSSKKPQRKVTQQKRSLPSRLPDISKHRFRMTASSTRTNTYPYQAQTVRKQNINTVPPTNAPIPLMDIRIPPPASFPNRTQSHMSNVPPNSPNKVHPQNTPASVPNSNQNQYSFKNMLQHHNNTNVKKENKANVNQTQQDIQSNKQPVTGRKYPDLSSRLSPIVPPPTIPDQLSVGNAGFQFPSTSKQNPLPSHVNTSQKPVPKCSSLEDLARELESRARILDLPEPVYKICTVKSEVYAKVKIGKYEMTTSAACERDARKAVMREALNKLSTVAEPNLPVTEDTNVIKDRIKTIIYERPSGVFEDLFPSLYTELYREKLPDNWLSIVKEFPAITLEPGSHKSVLVRATPNQNIKRKEDMVSPKKENAQFSPIGPKHTLPSLPIPNEEAWLVHVTVVYSTTEIWVRFVGDDYSVKYDDMMTEIAAHYSRLRQPVNAVFVGEYYAAYYNDLWHRVQCVDYDSATGEVVALFIDTAYEEVCDKKDLCVLDKKFFTLPAQAMKMRLAGLEDFAGCGGVENYLNALLLEETLFVVPKEVNDNVASVIFYDTRSEDDIILNDEILKMILRDAEFSGNLDEDQPIHEAHISHVERYGHIYVQIQSEYLKYLTLLMNSMISNLSEEKLRKAGVIAIDRTKVYLCLSDKNYYRGKVIDICDNVRLKVRLIDSGKIVIVERKNLYLLEKMSDTLSKYPPQAVPIKLPNIEKSMLGDKMVAKLIEIAPPEESLLMKIMSGSSHPPTVELYKRTESVMASISGILLLVGNDLKSVNGDGNNNVTRVKRREKRVDSRPCLKPPEIPAIGSYFDVHVFMAVNPSNFTVQPFSDKLALQEMDMHLQEVCKAYTGPSITPDSVKEGNLYAGKENDGRWYRAYVRKMNHANDIIVYFCDYGNFSSLSVDRLQPLGTEFLELPYQAIRAKLSGIKPIEIDWTFEDCQRFEELVVDRNFVSRIESLDPDELSPADMMLRVKLINVDTSEDIYIDQLLVQEKRAVRAND